MKRIFTTLVLISLLTVIVLPLLVSAQDLGGAPGCCTLKRAIEIDGRLCIKGTVAAPSRDAADNCTGDWCPSSEDNWGMYCLLNTVYNVTDWIFILLMLIVVVLIITGAFMFATAGGNPEKTTTARNFILYAIIGLVIALIARAVPTIVRLIMGM